MTAVRTMAGMRPSVLLLLLALVPVLLQGAQDPRAGYVLFPGDLVRIEVFDHPDLTTSFRVPSGGAVPFPLIGQLDRPAGRTVDALAAELRRRLEDGYLRRADVTIAIQEYGPRTAYVTGSLRRPGVVQLNPFVAITALQAISQCEGFSEDADRTAAVVIRLDAAGRTTVIPLRIGERGPAEGGDVVLRPQDVVLVPRSDRIHVIGQVLRPGPVVLPADAPMTVSRAVSAAGGFERYARESSVNLVRPGDEVKSIDVAAILAGRPGVEDPVLRPGDTVFVPLSRF